MQEAGASVNKGSGKKGFTRKEPTIAFVGEDEVERLAEMELQALEQKRIKEQQEAQRALQLQIEMQKKIQLEQARELTRLQEQERAMQAQQVKVEEKALITGVEVGRKLKEKSIHFSSDEVSNQELQIGSMIDVTPYDASNNLKKNPKSLMYEVNSNSA